MSMGNFMRALHEAGLLSMALAVAKLYDQKEGKDKVMII